jgi:hypothetical protein
MQSWEQNQFGQQLDSLLVVEFVLLAAINSNSNTQTAYRRHNPDRSIQTREL